MKTKLFIFIWLTIGIANVAYAESQDSVGNKYGGLSSNNSRYGGYSSEAKKPYGGVEGNNTGSASSGKEGTCARWERMMREHPEKAKELGAQPGC